MGILVILILAGLWAAVLVPPLLRARRETRGGDTIGDFNNRLGVLRRTNGTSSRPASARPRARGPRPDGGMTSVQRRRRDVLTALIVAALVTFALALAVGGAAWVLNLLATVLLMAYVALLARIKAAAAERQAKVHYLPTRSQHVSPYGLRRTVTH